MREDDELHVYCNIFVTYIQSYVGKHIITKGLEFFSTFHNLS